MAFIDFSLDSRIRKKYVPLTTQQRYMRHVKRVAARNLCIPNALIQPLLDASQDVTSKNLNLDEDYNFTSTTTLVDDIEESQALILKLNIAFYFTIIHPPLSICSHCNDQESSQLSSSPTTNHNHNHNHQQCNCNRVLYRSELVASANPSWKPFEGSTLCSPSISHFTIQLYFVQLDGGKDKVSSQSSHNNNNDTLEEPQLLSTASELRVDRRATSPVTGRAAYHRPTRNNISTKNQESVCCNQNEEAGTLFLQWSVHLCGLVCIGEEIPKDRRLAKNALIFGLHEGFYSALSSVTSEDLLSHLVPPREHIQVAQSSLVRRSYCMNTLTRIQMMQYIIQATAVEVQRVRGRLEEAIERTAAKREGVVRFERLRSSTAYLRELLARRREQLDSTTERLTAIESDIFELESETSSRVQLLKEQLHLLTAFRSERLLETRRKLELTVSALVQRRRALAKVLFQDVYRIVPFPDARGYAICGVFLPDSEHIDEHDSKMVSVGLGYVTHLVALLSSLLDVNLSYQLITFGSRSLIVDPNNTVLRESEKLLPLHSRSGRNAIFFKYGLYLLNRTIVGIRRSVGLKTVSVAKTLANLYSLFTECLLVDNYNLASDMTLNRISSYSPSFDLLEPELVALSTGDAWNQHFLNDINLIKDNDCMNDCLWREVEALTVSVALNRPNVPVPPSSAYHFRSQPRTPSMTPSLGRGDNSSTSSSTGSPSLVTTNTASSSGSSHHQSNNSPYVEELRQSIARQRLDRRALSSQRLSQITASLGSSYGVPPQQQPRPTPTIVSTISSPEDIIRARNQRGSCTNVIVGFNTGTSPSSPSSSMGSAAAAHTRLQALQRKSSPRATFNQHRRIRSISGYGAAHSLVSSYSSSSYTSARSSFLHPHEAPESSSSTDVYRFKAHSPQLGSTSRRKLSQQETPSNAAMLSCSLDKGLNKLLTLASATSASSLTSSQSTSASESQRILSSNGAPTEGAKCLARSSGGSKSNHSTLCGYRADDHSTLCGYRADDHSTLCGYRADDHSTRNAVLQQLLPSSYLNVETSELYL